MVTYRKLSRNPDGSINLGNGGSGPVILMPPQDLTDADRLAGWTDDDWTITRGTLELWRCQLNRKLTPEEKRAVGQAFEDCSEQGYDLMLPDFWTTIGRFIPPVLVIRWRCDPEHLWIRKAQKKWDDNQKLEQFRQEFEARDSENWGSE